MVMLRNAARLNGLTGLVITKLDVLDGLEEIKICTGYKHKGKVYDAFPPSIKTLEQCVPVYETHPGWSEDVSGIRNYKDFPENARKYLDRIKELSGVEIKVVSVGPGREATIVLDHIFD